MSIFRKTVVATGLVLGTLPLGPAIADPFFFSTGSPDGRIATASRPSSVSSFEIESADDFLLADQTSITSGTFTGLLTGVNPGTAVAQVVIEIYRVFPNDSNTVRTPTVPTRANSPSDVELTDRDSASGNLSFFTNTLGAFTVNNSVQPNGIFLNTTAVAGGDGPITGTEVEFGVNFTTPLDLPAGHYFFVPQVAFSVAGDEFLWLSAPRPIVSPGTPFSPDLQSWTRDQALDPDWLRVGTDIVGLGTSFNATFSLTGETTTAAPEPTSLLLLGIGLAGLAVVKRRRREGSGELGPPSSTR